MLGKKTPLLMKETTMKKLALLGLLLVLFGTGVAWAITESQAAVAPVLTELKLKPVPNKLLGGPMKYEVTDETIELLTKAKKAGRLIVLKPNGSIEFTKEK